MNEDQNREVKELDIKKIEKGEKEIEKGTMNLKNKTETQEPKETEQEIERPEGNPVHEFNEESPEEMKKSLWAKAKEVWKKIVEVLKGKKKGLYALLGIMIIIGLVYTFVPGAFSSITGMVVGGGKVASVDLYVMSQCPYGVQAEETFKLVKDKLGDSVYVNVEYIGDKLPDETYRSLHGQPEVDGDIIQLCAKDVYPNEYFEFISCQNTKGVQNLQGSLTTCMYELELDPEPVINCVQDGSGEKLLETSFAKARELDASGSPTIYINNKLYQGSRRDTDIIRYICETYSGFKPSACGDIPKPQKVDIILLNDERCGQECDTSQVVESLRKIFPKLEVEEIDYSSKKGKALYEGSGLTLLPAILFDESVQEDEGYSFVADYLDPAGDYNQLRIGSQFDPSKEVCDNEIDDTGDGLVDCDDKDCVNSFKCRTEIENDLQVFIMSDCPYGRLAVEALNELSNNFGDKLNYDVHYIANALGDGFQSLHGQYEVDEDIVQLCVKKHSPDKFLDYLYCRSVNGVKDVNWEDCATLTSINKAKVETCSTSDEGKELLRQDILIAHELGIGGSPTWIANNKYQFGGIDAESVKGQFCTYNNIEGCDVQLNSMTGVASTTAGCES